jgi:hypothetical protein
MLGRELQTLAMRWLSCLNWNSTDALLGEISCPFIEPRGQYTIHGSQVHLHRIFGQSLHCKAHK